MRYNPETDKARDIDDLVNQFREAAFRIEQVHIYEADDMFATEACVVWSLCQRVALHRNDRLAVSRMEHNLQRDMAAAMHYRPHQPEF